MELHCSMPAMGAKEETNDRQYNRRRVFLTLVTTSMLALMLLVASRLMVAAIIIRQAMSLRILAVDTTPVSLDR